VRKVRAEEDYVLPDADAQRGRADDHLRQLPELQQPLEVLLKQHRVVYCLEEYCSVLYVLYFVFKCGRCEQRKAESYQMQTRSTDEPMTSFVSCLNCSNGWKFKVYAQQAYFGT